MKDSVKTTERISIGMRCRQELREEIRLEHATAHIQHIRDGKVIWEETTEPNVKTNAGIDFLHSQGYNTSGAQANGLCYIALSNDTVTETATSTVLSNEIVANGLSRAIGTYAHTAGTTTTTISKTFTATGAQSAQKAALFSASSSGTMNHVLSFTQRTLANTDQLAVTFTITLS